MISEAQFLHSATTLQECPVADRAELAFIGRSNVGKSSLINALCKRKSLAHASSKPGRTKLMNFFDVLFQSTQGDEVLLRLTDLPGYGYAKTGKDKRLEFEDMIVNYLTQRANLEQIFVLIDSNIPPQAIDQEFVIWLQERGLPYTLVFTKSDKPTQKALYKTIKEFVKALAHKGIEHPHYCVVNMRNTKDIENVIESLI